MFKFRKELGGGWMRWAAPAFLVLVTLVPAASAQSTGYNRKMKREVSVMENILDQVVIDSRNVLVPSRHSVHGAYMEGFGVMFTTEASLLWRDWDWDGWNGHRWGNIEYKGDKIIIHKDDWDDDDEDDDSDKSDKTSRSKSRETWEARRTARADKMYKGIKDELTDALMDYGDTISSLSDNDWVGVTVYLGDDDYFHDKKISRLVIKAKMADVRSATAGRLSRDAVGGKVVVEEY